MESKTIDQKATLWNNKVLLSSFAVLILGTNAFNAYIHQQETNTLRIKYDRERSDKKDERILERAEQMILVNNFKRDIESLEKELKECENER